MNNRPRIRLYRLLALLALNPLIGAAAQGDLLRLSDPEALAVARFHSGGVVVPELREELAGLDWESARRTLAAFGSEGADLARSVEDIAGLGPESLLPERLDESCPALTRPLRTLLSGSGSLPRVEAVLSASAGNDQPSWTLLVRLEEPRPGLISMLRVGFASCADGTVPAQHDDVDLLLFGDDGARLVAFIDPDGLFVLASSPEAIDAVLTRRSTMDAPSLADHDPFSSFREPPADGLSFAFSLRPKALVDRFGGLLFDLGLVASNEEPLASLVEDALRTVDNVALGWSLDEKGLTSEMSLTVDEDGPDRKLAQLLLCERCQLSRPYLVPAQAQAVASGQLPLAEIVDYLEPFVEAAGGPGDLNDWIYDETGLDLQSDLLEWLGTQVHFGVLEPIGTDLRTLLYQPAQVLTIPVASEDEASAGLERIQTVLLAELEQELPVAVREYVYEGIPYTRFQASLNLDIAVGVVGSHLVLALPAGAIESVIDVYNGAPGIVGWPSYREAVRSAPSGVRALSLQDTSAQLSGLASLLELLSQPVAFALHTVIASESTAVEPFPLWEIDVAGLPTTLLEPGTVSGTLEDGVAGEPDPIVDETLSDLYRLEGVEAGDTVTVVVESEHFDTLLQLIDRSTGQVVEYNDDAPDTSRSELVFTAAQGGDYLVQVTSFGGSETGEYTLSFDRLANEPEQGPSLAETLVLLELPAKVLALLADHVGYTTSYTVTEGNVVYSRSVTDWKR